MTDHDARQAIERLSTAESGLQPWLWLPMLRLLAQGDPVSLLDLATAVRRPVQEVRRAVEAVPDVEYDSQGRIVGMGLTQRSTPHRYESGGEQLYTWCALDTLIFPTILGAPARIESADHATGEPVRLSVDGSGVSDLEPATAVVSLVNPEDLSSIRSAFCHQVHFFASAGDAAPWVESHPGARVIPVAQAYQLATAQAQQMLAQAASEPPSDGADGGCC